MDIGVADKENKRETRVVVWTCGERKCTERPKMADAGCNASKDQMDTCSGFGTCHKTNFSRNEF